MIAVVDYGVGNLASIENALNKLETSVKVSSRADVIEKAKALILPGVGAAGKGMENLRQRGLDKVIIAEATHGKPLLGICLGMQLLLSFSEEGSVGCLNVIKGKVRKFNSNVKVPQIGWNEVKVKSQKLKVKSLSLDIPDRSYFYFVNSYYCEPEEDVIVATTDYGVKFCSMLVKDNIVGTQFHPEKSGEPGMQLLKNWIDLC